MPRVTVIGSCHVDLIFQVDKLPAFGDSLTGASLEIAAGGKGLSQAVAAARLGAYTTLVGRMGHDMFGDLLLQTLAREGVDSSYLRRSRKHGTGVACPLIDSHGHHAIISVPRANAYLSRRTVHAAETAIRESDVLLLQLEAPQEANLEAAQIARSYDVPVILNAAPARPLSAEFMRCVSLIVLNRAEAAALTGEDTTEVEGMLAAAQHLRSLGPDIIVITLGAEGALLVHPENYALTPTHEVEVVDTAGAGEAFCAGLAVALANGELLLDAVNYGNACGALACTKVGGGPAMPTAAEVDVLLEAAELVPD